jgi:hypothetical protein
MFNIVRLAATMLMLLVNPVFAQTHVVGGNGIKYELATQENPVTVRLMPGQSEYIQLDCLLPNRRLSIFKLSVDCRYQELIYADKSGIKLLPGGTHSLYTRIRIDVIFLMLGIAMAILILLRLPKVKKPNDDWIVVPGLISTIFFIALFCGGTGLSVVLSWSAFSALGLGFLSSIFMVSETLKINRIDFVKNRVIQSSLFTAVFGILSLVFM